MADIFLSYAKEDREPARRIAKVLESCGWSVFWDRKIAAGDNWREVVQSELDGAGAVVVLWSETSVQGRGCWTKPNAAADASCPC